MTTKSTKVTKVLMIGNFGYKTNQLDGQTVKTRNVLALLKEMGYSQISLIDTSFKFQVLKLLFLIAYKKRLIVFVGAENAFKFLLPFISKAAAFGESEIHYFHIGNVLLDLIKKKPSRLKLLQGVKMNYPETEGMAGKLKKLGLQNQKVIPNFRVKRIKDVKVKKKVEGKIRLVYLGRILKEKGIDLIFQAYEALAQDFYKGTIEIDFYGQIVDPNLKFEEVIGASLGLNYKGFLNPNEITETLSTYDALLFPTYFHEEGFPGSILDAYLAGIPVLASDWMYNTELVDNGLDGLLFKPKSSNAIKTTVMNLVNDRELQIKLKKNAITKGKSLNFRSVKEEFLKNI